MRDTDSLHSEVSADLVYRKLSFENALFTARVYKRNFRNQKIRRLFRDNATSQGKHRMEAANVEGKDYTALSLLH